MVNAVEGPNYGAGRPRRAGSVGDLRISQDGAPRDVLNHRRDARFERRERL